MAMVLSMPDKTAASQRWVFDFKTGEGVTKITYHGLDSTVMYFYQPPTLGMVIELYERLKAAKRGTT